MFLNAYPLSDVGTRSETELAHQIERPMRHPLKLFGTLSKSVSSSSPKRPSSILKSGCLIMYI